MHVDCKFVKLNPLARIPNQAEEQAIGMDLFILPSEESDQCRWIRANEIKILPTGLIGIPPIGYHYEILLRSSTPKRYPGLLLANHVGLIDPSYCGPEDELKVAFYNSTSQLMCLKNEDIGNKPLVQLVIRANIFGKAEELSMEKYKNMIYSKQSRGGFGSTNKD